MADSRALTFTSEFGITGTFDASNGTLTLSGNASDADYQAVLDTVTYDVGASNGDPTEGGAHLSRAIDRVVNDGTVAGQITTGETTIDPFSAVTISDPTIDQTETVTITLSNATNGTLSNLDGGTFNTGTCVVTGSPLAVTTALDRLEFTPAAPSSGSFVSSTTDFLHHRDRPGGGDMISATAVSR